MNKINIKNILQNLFINKGDEYFITDSINDVKYTYSQFLDISLSIYDVLKNKGIKKRDTICYICKNSVNSLALYFANLLLGSIIAPIDILKGEKEINEVISMTKPRVILHLEDLEKIILNKAETNKQEVFDNIDYDTPFLITFTSGSTGESKGVLHSFSNLVHSGFEFGEKFDLNDENIFYHNFPMAYMAGILNLFIKPLIFGSKIVVSERLSVETAMNFWNKVIRYNVNSFWFNPTFVSLLMKLDRGQEGIEYVKNKKIIACIGTAPLEVNLKNKFEQKYGFELFESYGLSETLFLTTNYPQNNIQYSVGEPLDSVELSFSKDDEINVKTPWMFLKYINLNAEFASNIFPTGDLGFLKDNKLTISGRKKDIIIKGGVNISPKKIESFISDWFEEVVIMGLKDGILGEKIACFYVADKFDDLNKKHLNASVVEKLGKDYSIDAFYKLEQIPKNINGKTDKIKLKEEYAK